MYLLLKLRHVRAAFGLVTGLVGRAVTFRGAARAGTIEPELRAALEDRGVLRARALEAGLIAAIVILMVLKP